MADDRTQPEEKPPNQERARAQVQALLGKAHSVRAEVAAARRDAQGTAALDLATAESNVAQVENELDGAAASGAVSEQTVTALKAVLASVERAAENAVQGAAASLGSGKDSGGDLAAVSAETRRVVQDVDNDIFGKKIFDPYLRFKTPEEEREYREREEKRQKEIEEALHTHTPEGNLRAAEITQEQLHDAGDHGARNSPKYQEEENRLADAKSKLQQATARSAQSQRTGQVVQSGSSTDDHAQMEMRKKLESKGLPPEAVTRVLAAADPIRAARQYTMAANADAHAAAAEPPARPFAGEHDAGHDIATADKKAAPAPSMVAGIDLGGLGIEEKPETRTAASDKPKPAKPVQVAEIDLKGLGLDTGLMDTPGKGHGLPDQAKPVETKTPGRTTT